MKKNYIFTTLFFLITVLTVKAQLLTEDFSSAVPPAGWTIDAHAGNWIQNNSNQAGGTAPEAIMRWDYPTNTPFNGTTRLITPSMDLTGVNNIILTFKHKVNTYANSGYTIGVATRSNGGTWNNVWTMNPADVTEERSILISNIDMNQANVEVCFFFSGDSYQINFWHIDDVSLIIAEAKDLKLSSIQNEPFTAQGNQTIGINVTNLGVETVTSFDATYTINGSSPVTETVSGVNITTTNSYTYSFTTPWNATPGNYNLSVAVSNINGTGDDNNTSNDSQSKNISVATQTAANTPLYEVFTSSTCGPCAGFNVPVMTPFMNSHQDIAVIKYQMNWPSPGDPYYTAEGGDRRAYYNVSGVPSLFSGGEQYATSTAGLNDGYTTETGKDGFFDIQADFSIDGNNIIIHETIMPYISGNYKIHTAVIEKQTTQNTGNNGETSFERVMMKMLPDANGVDFNFGANQAYTHTYTFDMSTTNVEEMSDLAVVVFIQYDGSKRILQSKYIETASPLSLDDIAFKNVAIYPNPSKGLLHINTDKNIQISITDVLGKTIVPLQNFNNNNTIDISNLNNGMYIVKVSDGKTNGSLKIILNK